MINLDTIKKLRSEVIGFFRFKKLDAETYLITNDVGKYALLSLNDFSDNISSRIHS